MHYTIYTSHALIPASAADHNDILAACRRNNIKEGVTGFLHREGDHFLQYLEGSEAALETVLARISADPRHEAITVLAQGKLASRHLPDWQMGFVDGGQLSLAEMLDTSADHLALATADPIDLISFVVFNAECLRRSQAA
ncbi:BLUF domain-containing protein [Pseudoruegeria sp. SHC-113]|uniref:BLUF domain-containing protein n=1 Tax=Pseudoruegeria sp. SHC-113 TaxID=2855439 RepID=UPI0021BAB31C|nr:BLUF domain-containing protein [Pseudoruegeria sp. SHC-113]MCT8159497.1 BLUF domain-containing protein [Pseudoruegeria sp. SHC-113]